MNKSMLRRTISSFIAASSVALASVSVALAQEPALPTEPAAVAGAAGLATTHDSATSLVLPPDENLAAGRDRVLAVPTFSYYQVAGTTLRPRSSSTEYVYDGSGCSHVSVGTGTGRILNTELLLPEGAVIKYLRVYYRDTNAASGVQGYLTRYQPGVGAADLATAGSTAPFTGGFGFAVSEELTEIVDNSVYAYTLIGWPGDSNVANQICGLRIAYYAPATAPGAPTLNPPTVTGNTVALSWTASGGTPPTSYVLTATNPSGAVLATVPLTGTSATFPGVPSGTYLLTLVAVNEVGSSPPSATVTAVVP